MNGISFRQKPLILCIEDDPSIAEVTALHLQGEGWKVHCEPTALHALEWLKFNKPDVIVSDVMMPRMSGFEFARKVREAGDRETWIAFFSAMDLPEERAEARQAGGDTSVFIGKGDVGSFAHLRQTLKLILERGKHSHAHPVS